MDRSGIVDRGLVVQCSRLTRKNKSAHFGNKIYIEAKSSNPIQRHESTDFVYLDVRHRFNFNMHQCMAVGAVVISDRLPTIGRTSPLNRFSCQTLVLEACQMVRRISIVGLQRLETDLSLWYNSICTTIHSCEFLTWNAMADDLPRVSF